MKPISTLLSLLSLALLTSCSHKLPSPDITWYGIYLDASNPGFYAVDKQGKNIFVPSLEIYMHGAQCLKYNDFYVLQEYLESLKELEVQNK